MRAAVNRRMGGFPTHRFIKLSIILIILFCLTSPKIAHADEDNPWVTTGSLNTARMGHSAVFLANGKVLVAGGGRMKPDSTVFSSSELFNPGSGTWTYTGEMHTTRAGQGTAELADGRVLVVGGYNHGGSGLTSAEIYDPDTETWSYTNGVLPTTMVYPAVTLLQNGKVLIAGGLISQTTATSAAYLFDPSTGNFTSAGSMNAVRVYHSATLLPNGKVLVTGGTSSLSNPDNVTALRSIDLYDPETGTWASAGALTSMNHTRLMHTTTLLLDGRVLVAGGSPNMKNALNTAELYDPATGSWAGAGAMVTGRYFHTATRLFDGKVLVTCGSDNSQNSLASAEMYDPNAGLAGTWSLIYTPMAFVRVYHSATIVDSFSVLVTGGSTDGENALATSQLYVDDRALVTISLANLTQIYDGNANPVSFTTDPSGHEGDVTIIYTGTSGIIYGPSTTAPTDAGTYAVTAYLSTNTEKGSVTDTLIINKATATVQLGNLNQTYNGNPRSVTVTTTPSGLSVTTIYSGTTYAGTTYGPTATPPDQAGSYSVTTTVNDLNYQGSANGTLTVAKATTMINLTNLNQTYDGNPKPVTVNTTPGGLNVTLSYSGISGTTYGPTADPPTQAGSYNVSATVNDPNYQGSANGTLTVARKSVTVTLSNLNQTYDSNPHPVSVTTNPAGLSFILTYTGIEGTTYGPSSSPPVNAGKYNATATITDPNHQGSTNGTLTVAKASAIIQLSGLSQTFDGNPKPVTVTTTPSNLSYILEYTGIDITYGPSDEPPSQHGTYNVTVTITDTNYSGATNGILVIGSKMNAEILISGLTQTYNGDPKPVTVTTTPAGLAVVVTYSDTGYSDHTIPPTNAGSYSVQVVVQDDEYQGSTSATLEIQKANAIVQLSGLFQLYDGNPKSVTVTTNPPGLTVTLSFIGIDGTIYGPSPAEPSQAGTYRVEATVEDANYQGTGVGTMLISEESFLYLPAVVR